MGFLRCQRSKTALDSCTSSTRAFLAYARDRSLCRAPTNPALLFEIYANIHGCYRLLCAIQKPLFLSHTPLYMYINSFMSYKN